MLCKNLSVFSKPLLIRQGVAILIPNIRHRAKVIHVVRFAILTGTFLPENCRCAFYTTRIAIDIKAGLGQLSQEIHPALS